MHSSNCSCILLLQLFVFVNSEGKNCISTLLLTSRFIHYLLYYLSYNKFIVPTTGCDAISSGGTCYSHFTSTGINWVDARLQCVSRGYDLATVTSLEENTLMFSLNPGSNCWIGINDRENEDTFIWADGTESTYTRWSPGEPNDVGGTEDCGETFGNENWNDDPCTRVNLCYLCSTTGKVIY